MKELSGGVQGFVDALADAGDKLVIVEVYAPWCNACRAVFPKICQMVGEKQETVVFLKVDLEKNKDMCKTLGIKVLPSFLFYRASEGKVDHFSCTVSKVQRFKDALELHSGAFCSLKPFPGVPEYPDVVPHPELHPAADTPTKLDKKLTPWW